jgi:hypothetical protein
MKIMKKYISSTAIEDIVENKPSYFSSIESVPIQLVGTDHIPNTIEALVKITARYMGTIRSRFGVGTCFLHESGHIVTSLHVISNLSQLARSGDIDSHCAKGHEVWMEFVDSSGRSHTFQGKEIVNDGLKMINDNASTPRGFDFAIIALDVDPRPLIGPGLPLDSTNYFGSAGGESEALSISISKPTGMISESGEFHYRQHYSVAVVGKNSGPYRRIDQTSQHGTVPGDSGKALLKFFNGKLWMYSMNQGSEGGDQTGVRAETLALYWTDRRIEYSEMRPQPYFSFSAFRIYPHKFEFQLPRRRESGKNEASESKHFLTKMADEIQSDPNRVPLPSFTSGTFTPATSSYQDNHMARGSGKSKISYFSSYLDARFQTIAIIVKKAVEEVLDPAQYEKIKDAVHSNQIPPNRNLNFYVDCGFPIGTCRRHGETSWVKVDSPFGAYHIFPDGSPESGSARLARNDVWIDLPLLLDLLIQDQATQ